MGKIGGGGVKNKVSTEEEICVEKLLKSGVRGY